MDRFSARRHWRWGALVAAFAATLALTTPSHAATASESGTPDDPAGMSASATPGSSPEPSAASEAAPAPAEGGDIEVGAAWLQEFTVLNLTNQVMKFHGWETMSGWAGTWFDDIPAPAVGESWEPGQKNIFSLTFRAFALNGARMTYSLGGSVVKFDATVDAVNTPAARCVWTNPDVRCSADGGTITLTSTTPSSHIVGPEDRQRQYDTLHTLCDPQAYTAATCTYRPNGIGTKMVSETPRFITETHHVNCRPSGEDALDYRFQKEIGGSSALSVTGEFSLNIAQVVTVAVAVTHMQTVTWNQALVVNHSLRVPPYHSGWFDYYPAVLRVNGDFVVQVGDDSIVISDVWVETMVTDPVIKGVIVSRNEPIPTDAIERLCKTPPPPLPSATGSSDATVVSVAARSFRTADALERAATHPTAQP